MKTEILFKLSNLDSNLALTWVILTHFEQLGPGNWPQLIFLILSHLQVVVNVALLQSTSDR